MNPRILICTPIVTGVGPKAYASHCQMWKWIGTQSAYSASEMGEEYGPPPYYASHMVVGPRRAPRNIRNEAARTALASGATHLFFLDDDIIVEPRILDTLVVVDKPIVGALLYNSEGLPLVWDGDDESEITFPDYPRTGAFPCWAVALGAMLIKTEVFKALPPPWFWFDKTLRTMDVNFCRSAQEAGIEVWCSASPQSRQIIHDEREI